MSQRKRNISPLPALGKGAKKGSKPKTNDLANFINDNPEMLSSSSERVPKKLKKLKESKKKKEEKFVI
jgi:hypothetical protein